MFITFEGPDGSGKSSQIRDLSAFLREKGYKVYLTYEPGGTDISDQIKDILKSMDNKAMHPRTEILLFCSARAQLVEEEIRPRLAQGEIVISDRYADSTLAYQGYGHRVDLGILRSLLNFATGGLWPDLTLLLDVDVEEGLKRKRKEGNWDRLDDYELEFHRRVRNGYHNLAGLDPARWQMINANQAFDEVQEQIRGEVLQYLEKKMN